MQDESLLPEASDFETIAAHAGMGVRVGETLSTVAPLVASTTFTSDSIAGVHAALGPDAVGYAYARNANPTVANLENVLAQLETAEQVVAFSSGMSAIHAVMMSLELEPGDVIVAADALYGVSRALFSQFLTAGIETMYIDIYDLKAVNEALTSANVRVLYFETLANPLLQVADIPALARLGRAHQIPTVVDNTFATPYLLKPLQFGIDIVVHSATKYLAGHGDVTAGIVATNASWGRRIQAKRAITGGVLSPFEAWLTLRGLRTLPVRMERQTETASEVADWLTTRPWVSRTHYPGLPDNRFRDLAATLFGGRFGAMVAFDLDVDQSDAMRFIDELQLITAGTSLGDVASLVLYPAMSSHRSLTLDEQSAAGIGPGLIRLSIGLESARDICRDLQSAAVRSDLAALAPPAKSARRP